MPLQTRFHDTGIVGYWENGDISWYRVAFHEKEQKGLLLLRNKPPVREVAVVGLPSEAGIFLEEAVVWERAHPKEPFLEGEWNALLQELRIRCQEASRRLGWSLRALRLLGVTIRDVRLDGKRVISPVGFSGRTLSLCGRATFLFSEIRGYPANGTDVATPLLLDDAVLRLLGIRQEGVYIVLEERTSSVSTVRGGKIVRRATFAMGHEAIRRKFMRLCALSSLQAADELLGALAKRELHARIERRVRQHLFSALRAWGEHLVIGAKLPTLNTRYTIFNTHPFTLFFHSSEQRLRPEETPFSQVDDKQIFFHELYQWFPERIAEPREAVVRLIAEARFQFPELLFYPAIDHSFV